MKLIAILILLVLFFLLGYFFRDQGYSFGVKEKNVEVPVPVLNK